MSIQNSSFINRHSIKSRIKNCFLVSYPKAIKTSFWLLKIILPVTITVLILEYTGILRIIALWFAPLFTYIGLPGESALVLLTSIFTNIYSAIAVITTLGFENRPAIIIAVMCLISHAFIVETAIVKKTGSKVFNMILIRLIGSAVAGILLNLILPEFDGVIGTRTAISDVSFISMLGAWCINSIVLIIKIILLITLLMFFQKILEEFGIINYLGRILRPLMKLMGLPESTTFSWIVANTLGLSYGAAIIIEQVEERKMNKDDADLLNHHIVISHSQLEDPLLFAAIGLPLLWLIWPRLILAVAVVWLKRFYLAILLYWKIKQD